MVWHPVEEWWRRRKLTITEHERLMGFPDGYTAVEHMGKPASDAVRRHAIGNSMDVRVMTWLGERIALTGE